MYLERLKLWKRLVFNDRGSGSESQVNPIGKLGLRTALISIGLVFAGIAVIYFWPSTYYNPYKGVGGVAFAALPGKPLNFQIVNRAYW